MSPSLQLMDSLYNNVISHLPHKDKLSYCEHLIDRSQLTILNNKKYLNKNTEELLVNIISAAQLEIKNLLAFGRSLASGGEKEKDDATLWRVASS